MARRSTLLATAACYLQLATYFDTTIQITQNILRLRFDMETTIKSIILYDAVQNVCGFVELRSLRSAYNKTQIKATHNFELGGQIILSLVTPHASFAFTTSGPSSSFLVDKALDLESEVFANLMRKVDKDLISLASGVINFAPRDVIKSVKREAVAVATTPPPEPEQGKIEHEPQPEEQDSELSAKIAEVDAVLRSVCMVEEGDRGICEGCPYREHFFEFGSA